MKKENIDYIINTIREAKNFINSLSITGVLAAKKIVGLYENLEHAEQIIITEKERDEEARE